MKKFIITLLLALSVLPLAAQTVIAPRRPMRFLTLEGGATFSGIRGFDKRVKGTIFPTFGVALEVPIMSSLDLITLRLTYINKGFTGVPTEAEPVAAPSHQIHALEMGLLGFNWYPFKQYFYVGGSFNFGGNFLIRRIEEGGEKVPLKIKQKDALGLTLGVDVEVGFSFSFWPVGDRLLIFGRYSTDILGSPFSSAYRNDYPVFPKKMRAQWFTAGIRVPIIMARD